MTKTETLTTFQNLLLKAEALQVQTLGINTTCLSDLIDVVNAELYTEEVA